MIKSWKRFGVVTGLSLTLVAAGCGADEEEDGVEENGDDVEEAEEEDEDDDEEEEEEDEDADEEAAGENYNEELEYTITGIDAGAGVMAAAEQAVEDYDLDFEVMASSDAAMTGELGSAIENEEPIIVTGWDPHWKFQEYDLKYLDDPEGSFGEAEDIHTIVREGLEEDQPEAYEVLDNFSWTSEDMEEVMLEIYDGADEQEAAQAWIEENEDTVNEWTDGVDEVDGESIELAYVTWDTEIASTNVVATVLEDLGYEVDMSSMEANHMFSAVAGGDADAHVAAWLPATHEEYYGQMEEDFEDLGANLEGAAIGLVVPEYMDIDSIEDLQD
ncbi:glycine betaine ABC transporter substrate-binding protein [Salsuginibacillus kocurii]|uniref:glycine betaine ABC transporter substrate-binding protein n=1 Tax=Salsuginibacillus kocurii TaxID=427078 RepID=UPI00037519A3|nr:glycine betaine ABC transporter substrate-binding protein [Salsuginibacillus kocurii]